MIEPKKMMAFYFGSPMYMASNGMRITKLKVVEDEEGTVTGYLVQEGEDYTKVPDDRVLVLNGAPSSSQTYYWAKVSPARGYSISIEETIKNITNRDKWMKEIMEEMQLKSVETGN